MTLRILVLAVGGTAFNQKKEYTLNNRFGGKKSVLTYACYV